MQKSTINPNQLNVELYLSVKLAIKQTKQTNVYDICKKNHMTLYRQFSKQGLLQMSKCFHSL